MKWASLWEVVSSLAVGSGPAPPSPFHRAPLAVASPPEPTSGADHLDASVEILGMGRRLRMVRYKALPREAVHEWRETLRAVEGRPGAVETSAAIVRVMDDFLPAIGLDRNELPPFEVFQLARAILRGPEGEMKPHGA